MIYIKHKTAVDKLPSQSEQAVRNCVQKYRLEYYDDILGTEAGNGIDLYLSVKRTGLLGWYPFKEGAHVLEIGTGFGDLTGILCDCCAHVTSCEKSVFKAETAALRWEKKNNLLLYAGEWEKIVFDRKFDYVMMTGDLECACGDVRDGKAYGEYLKKASQLLMPNGVLLLSVRNRFGMKYFCGEPEPYTKQFFAGINGYPDGTMGRLLSRDELECAVKAAGFSSYRFFYPLPDEINPQFIYSDGRLPERTVADCLDFNCQDAVGRIAVEHDLFCNFVGNGVFPFFSNAFLVECCAGEQKSDLMAADLSEFRKKRLGAAGTPSGGSDIDRQKIYRNTIEVQELFCVNPSAPIKQTAELKKTHQISDKMRKIQMKELEILDQVRKLCEKHGLQFFMVHGTLLGAVRHKGFIPWDDDLDIGMLREDYDKFLRVAEEELESPFFLQTLWTDPDCFFGHCVRIRNSETAGIQVRELGHSSNQGLWIDIQCFDAVPADETLLRRKVNIIKHFYRLLNAKIYGRQESRFVELNPWRWKWYRLISHFCSHEKLCEGLSRALSFYADEDSEDIAVFGYGMPQRLHRKDFTSFTCLEFEGRLLPAPAGYKDYLFCVMGKDYMHLPPPEEQKPKHTGIFDPDRPYTEYMKKLSGMFEDLRGKQIILFGAGLMFEDYMSKWGGRYRPAFLVDNDENKWGKRRMGIEIKDPEALLLIPEEKRRLIICSYYYKEIEKQLDAMGISDYKVYIQHLEWILESEKRE